MEASTPLSNIPNDIIRHILLQLSMKAVIRCQCVCKRWRSLIDDSYFKLSYHGQPRVIILSLESKTRYYYVNSKLFVTSTSHDLRLHRHISPFGKKEAYPLVRASQSATYLYPCDVRALCSCNGFVLLGAKIDIWLWNPSTKCSMKVLKSPYKPIIIRLGGLCYDSLTRDYKVVLLFLCRPTMPGHDYSDDPFAMSASLNHKEWRPVQFPCNSESASGGVEFRNTFHWWASDIKNWDWDWDRDFLSGGYRNKIIYFDPVYDEFRFLPTPELMWHERENSIVGLGVINDCLCMALESKTKTETMQVLIMKEYGRQDSWMTAFAIQMSQLGDINTYGLTFYSQKKNNSQEVLFILTAKLDKWQIYVYDQKKGKLKEDPMDFPTSSSKHIVSMCFYVESLACPNWSAGLIWRGDDDDEPTTNSTPLVCSWYQQVGRI